MKTYQAIAGDRTMPADRTKKSVKETALQNAKRNIKVAHKRLKKEYPDFNKI